MGFEAFCAGRGKGNPVWSGEEAHWPLREWIVKPAEHCGADYNMYELPSEKYVTEAKFVNTVYCVGLLSLTRQMDIWWSMKYDPDIYIKPWDHWAHVMWFQNEIISVLS